MLPMGQMTFTILEDRGILCLSGEDRVEFLQNIVTNDVALVSGSTAIWAALLTPQGKYLHDFFVVALGDILMLDCERTRIDDLRERLGRYKLRSRVEIHDVSEAWAVAALMGTDADSDALVGLEGRGGPFGGGVCYVDPRYGAIGARALVPRDAVAQLPAAGFEEAEPQAYDHHRLCIGLPDGSRDLEVDKALPMENGFDALHGIAWDKGCYVGQEITARMRYRANARRQLLPVEIDGPVPPCGAPVMLGEREAGEMRSAAEGIGLALLRLDALESLAGSTDTLTAGDADVTPLRPPWLASAGSDETPSDPA